MRLKQSLFRKRRKKESLFKYIMSVSHLWLGLLSSVVVFVVCFSGAMYSFKTQISELLNYKVVFNQEKTNTDWIQPDQIKTNFLKEGHQVTNIIYPADFSRNILVAYHNQEEDYDGHYYIHPTSGAIIGSSSRSTGAFFDLMKSLHKNLLLGKVGNHMVGISILIFVVLLVSGLVLWFPKNKKQWKQGFKVKWSAKLPRVIYDLHNTLGFYTFLLLLFISITGLYVSYAWVKSTVVVSLGGQPVLNASNAEDMKSELSNVFASFLEESIDNQEEKKKDAAVSLNVLLEDSDQRLPYKGITTIQLPTEDNPHYQITKIKQESIFSAVVPDHVKYGKDGKFKKLILFSDQSIADQFMEVSLPLHTGEILGLSGIILYFIVTMIACSMPVTGILIWVRKL
ncbi:PepSY-associated TM helix domain-containing protein [Flammeovirga aprica]|uniref:PepSY domain-containing protein n=1 Tax=Flammeovirga aprica JL-4 TaxID=694437 RepID=A0A7X9X9I5_9BACT|nr:PepSY-associated TM helix domain-containing protein [Flammeovirga aprica]NME68860.1 PepSY domain-containing protein [Flammeovirga aprica JL-4]